MRSLTAAVTVAFTAVLSLGSASRAVQPADPPEEFVYRGQTWSMEGYSSLFAGDALRDRRRAIFEKYLASAAEGQRRAKAAGTTVPSAVWKQLTPEEKTTFLAITKGMGTLQHPASKNTLIDWIDSLEEIRGLRKESNGSVEGSHVYRLYAKLTRAATDIVMKGEAEFVNSFTTKRLDFGGLGSTHDDFCTSAKFERQRPTDNHPHVQFNITSSSCCADIDIDYIRPPLPGHFQPDNSNVLAGSNVKTFAKQVLASGLRGETMTTNSLLASGLILCVTISAQLPPAVPAETARQLLNEPDVKGLFAGSRREVVTLLRTYPAAAKTWQLEPSLVKSAETIKDDDLFDYFILRTNAVLSCGVAAAAPSRAAAVRDEAQASVEALAQPLGAKATIGALSIAPACGAIVDRDGDNARISTAAEFKQALSLFQPFANSARLGLQSMTPADRQAAMTSIEGLARNMGVGPEDEPDMRKYLSPFEASRVRSEPLATLRIYLATIAGKEKPVFAAPLNQ